MIRPASELGHFHFYRTVHGNETVRIQLNTTLVFPLFEKAV